jgi:ubiquinone/menaquinone biosynthesis C-methylase UbiE
MSALAKQYDNFADDFARSHNISENSNRFNRETFYNHIDFLKPGMKFLDIGCGDGTDLTYYKNYGADVYGLDASKEMIRIAHSKLPDGKLFAGYFESMPFRDSQFDAVLSKYAIMTSADMMPIFKEIHRVLKAGWIMMYLATHPFRQFFEKRDERTDYFEQKIVDSHILGNTITVREPSHTMTDYLNPFLFKNFDVHTYDEYWDPAAEAVDGKKYPGFLS